MKLSLDVCKNKSCQRALNLEIVNDGLGIKLLDTLQHLWLKEMMT